MFKMVIKRAGIAMIELIFAIVIMGIVLMSAPMLISQATQAGMSAVQQEAIVAGASEMGMILTRHWDEQDTNESLYSPVLITNENITALKEATDADGNLTGRRVGTPELSSRSFLTSGGGRLNASDPTAFITEGDFDDIDDFNNHTATLVSSDSITTQQGDYIDTSLNMSIGVSYIDAPSIAYNSTTISFTPSFTTAATGTSNIKAIVTNVTSGSHDAELGTNITLRAFSCNIGTYELKERSF